MPKLKSSPVLTCDICEFKATNGYIFKRHLHRCFSLHGIASKRSTSRNPIRLKGTEGLLTKDSSCEAAHDLLSGGSLASGDDQVPAEDGTTEFVQNDEDIEEQQIDSVASLQWEPTSSSQLLLMSADVSPEDQDVIPLDQDVSQEDQDVSPEDQDVSPGDQNVPPGDQDAVREMSESTSGDIPRVMPGAPYCRQYSCNECPYECKSAREYWLHQRNAHGRKMKIYACCVCDYASRYSNKVERHLTVHNKATTNVESQERELKVIELTCQSADSQGAQDSSLVSGGLNSKEAAPERPKIQPLKLKRLNIKMPFKVAKSYTYKPGSLFAAGQRANHKMALLAPGADSASRFKPGPYKEVFRLVLSEDGSHHYQCRDCLYYASVPSSVKKHHALCHSRLLCCPHCPLSTTGQGIYYEHLITHEGYGYLKCPECSYVTNAKSNLEKHRSFHNGNFPVHCSVCSFSADSESKIKRHVATQHMPPNASMAEELNMPQVCAVGVSFDGSLDHQLTEQNSAVDGSIAAADIGQEMVYGNESKDDGPSDGSRLVEYRCPKCPMVCYRRGNFTRHLTAKHKVNQSTAASLSKSIEGKIAKVLKRKRAASSFTGLKQMRFQMMENLKCSHCSYIAKWPSDLRRHMQVHTLIKRFKCSMCTNKYKYLGDLNVHMRRDHNTEPPDNIAREVATSDALTKASPAMFRCPVCPFASQSKAELEQHSRNHANTEKTYQCRQCDYQTYWRGDVSRHLFRHHKIVLSKEATEIWAYFLHRPDIKPLTKQGGAAAAAAAAAGLSLSPPLLLDATKSTPTQHVSAVQFSPEKPQHTANVHGKSRKASPASGTVFLKEGSFICEYPNCDFKTTISDRMEVHLAVHQNLKLFMCPTCGKRTNWKWDVVKHMNKVHMNTTAVIEDVITLSIDQAKATIQDYLNSYEKKSKNLVVSYCSLCSFKSLDRNRVVRHLGTVHKNENGTILSMPMIRSESLENSLNIQTEEGSGYLDGDRFPLDGSGEEMPAPKFVEPPSEELAQLEKPYACAICRKPGSTKGDVKKHYNYTHPYKDVRIIYVGDGTEFNYYTGEIYQKSAKSDQSLDSPDMKSGIAPLSPLGKTPRPDSKFSNPKMHGYVKPFKCSICGLRSNWKWDLKKHLRSKHPNEGGFVILLSIEEASETYGKDCTPSHPKNEDFLSVFSSSPSPVPSLTPSNPSLTPSNPSPGTTDDHVFKPPPNIKAEILDDDSNEDDSQDELSSSLSYFSQSPASSVSPSPRPRGRESSTSLDPSRRQWRCSACNYISNWRRNMARHIHRKHPEQEDTVQVLALHDISDSAKACAGEDLPQNTESVETEASSCPFSVVPEVPEKKVNFGQSEMRLWNCSHCAFSSRLRTHIIVHMQQHELKPFACGICGIPFMNRGPLHRHLQKVHKRSDYLKLCKVNIKYSDEPAQVNEEEVTRNEYINSYFCRLCSLESLDRSQIVQHLEDVHGSAESDNNILKIQKHVGGSAKRRAALERFSKNNTAQKWNKKVHFCTICPFRTLKKSMLAFHMTYHKPNSVNKFKCKYCPYYVGALRLLHQHQRKWHKESTGQIQWGKEEQTTPTQSPTKLDANPTSPQGTPRRHCCEKCPYTTNSKNDFIYHKQFHRPKRTAEFKCEFCDYWVVHKRLLKQHMRLHTTFSPSCGTAAVDISPAKSLCSDPGLVYDPIELTELAAIKQKMISAKITASLSNSPTISPMKLASQCSVDSKPGYVIKNGLYRKLHKCRFCPYTNIRSRNMQLHEMMHGPRDSSYPLMKCPYCDYYVGSKGLLSHHMKVHQKTYGDTPENDAELGDLGDALENDEESDQDIPQQQKVDTLLQISRFKRFGCERCPYASAKRQHFVRHLELHGSRQRYTCQYCDYSVPSNNLLLQHTKLHIMPNQNLLASQSITNLQYLSEVPADVALASALPPADSDTAVTISVIHDHLGLYENSIYDCEPKKLYRCDRCPYANVRRDYLLSHLKFHMVPSSLVCPYCDYSAPKQPLLTQHIRVHFCPLPELSDWLLENGQTERETSQRSLDLAEALKVAHEYQNKSKKKDKAKSSNSHTDKLAGRQDEKPAGKENIQAADVGDGRLIYICQYCDREFLASDKLVKHELQHLIGNHFERMDYLSRIRQDQATMKILSDRQRQQQKQQQYPQTDQSAENHYLEKKEKNSSKEDSETEGTLSTDRNLCNRDTVLLADGAGVRVQETDQTRQVIGDNMEDSHNMETGRSDISNTKEIQEDKNAAHESASSHVAGFDAANQEVCDVMDMEDGTGSCHNSDIQKDHDSVSEKGHVMFGNVKERKRKRKRVFKGGSDVNGMLNSNKKSCTEVRSAGQNPSCLGTVGLQQTASCGMDSGQVAGVGQPKCAADVLEDNHTRGGQVDVLEPSSNVVKLGVVQMENGENNISVLGENCEHNSDVVKLGADLGENCEHSSDVVKLGADLGENCEHSSDVMKSGADLGENCEHSSDVVKSGADLGENCEHSSDVVKSGADLGENCEHSSDVKSGADLGENCEHSSDVVKSGADLGENCEHSSDVVKSGADLGENCEHSSDVKSGADLGENCEHSSDVVKSGADLGENCEHSSDVVKSGADLGENCEHSSDVVKSGADLGENCEHSSDVVKLGADLGENCEHSSDVVKSGTDQEKRGESNVSVLEGNSGHSSEMVKSGVDQEKNVRRSEDNSTHSNDVVKSGADQKQGREKNVSELGDNPDHSSDIAKSGSDPETSGEKNVRMLEDKLGFSSDVDKSANQDDQEKNDSVYGDQEERTTFDTDISQLCAAVCASDMEQSV